MQNSSPKKTYKTVIINRAVSGSGKTTLSRCVTEALRAHGLTVTVHSTDEFFMKDGRYCFDLNMLNRYHAQNLADFTADLERGTDVVICDNMNLLPWQSQPYTDAARKYRYRILFLNFLPRELEKHCAAQIVTPEKPDAHGLSKELLERFIRNFNDYNDLLDRNTVRDIKRHHVFVWNDFDKVAMDTGEIAPYFDSDAVITIRPEEYQEMKRTLADAVLKVITDSEEELGQREIKKHYLLSWYGITDIRAALGLEPTDGPVMGALRTGAFTDAIILGYTNSGKKNGFTEAMRAEWEKLHSRPLEERLAYPRNKAQLMVDAICNTESAHSLFLNYLKSANLPVRIRLEPQKLEHLNDAHGIDNAAREALRLALSDEEEKDITCFLSPGTPVMAYTWAMVSRTNPNLHLRVISSSDPRKPPEEIDLPKDMFSRRITGRKTIPSTAFDVTIHLLGTETNIPQFFSLVQFPSQKHWLIASASGSGKETALRHLLPDGATMETKTVDAFVPAQTRKAVEAVIRSFPQSTRIGVNLTGGTKLMFAGGLNACEGFSNAEPFYFDIKQHNITFLRTGASIPFRKVDLIDGFFTASGYHIVTPGHWNDNPAREARKELTMQLWQNRNHLGTLYKAKAFRDYQSKPGKPDEFDFEVKKIHVALKKDKAALTICGESIPVPPCTDFASYIGGGWLEEYAYMQLLPLQERGLIRDLRIGVEVVPFGQEKKPGEMPYGEFDCVFTDGSRLFLVECKAGCMKQEFIQKLENNLKTYGGLSAKGFFVTSFPVSNPAHKRRIAASKAIQCIPTDVCNPDGMMKALFN